MSDSATAGAGFSPKNQAAKVLQPELPLPWTAYETSEGVAGIGSDEVECVVAAGLHPADAAFIVRACNAHDDLVKALKAMSDMYAFTWDMAEGGLMMMASGVERFEKAHALAVAALAKAEGR